MAYLPTFDPTDIATKADIAELRREMDQRFEAIDRRFEQMDQRFEAIDRRFEQMDQRFEAIDRRFGGIDRRFEGIDRQFLELNLRLDRLFHTLLAGMFVVLAAMIGLAVLIT